MRVRTWSVLALVACLALVGCDRKVEKEDENGAATQAEEAEEAQETDESQEVAAEQGQIDGEKPSVADLDELDPVLLNPEEADEEAPETFRARFETTKGDFVVEFHRDWAPNGVDRAYNLIDAGYYDGIPFFRVVDGFMAQFGIHGHPEVNEAWEEANADPDPVEESNTRGKVTFAQKADPETRQSDPGTRTTHLFINYTDNSSLDEQGFAPVGEVVEGMDVVDNLYSGYGGGPPTGPDQKRAIEEGEEYFKSEFPRLDYIETAEIVEE